MILKRKNQIIAKNVILLKSFFRQAIGLRFSIKQKNLIFDFKKERNETIDMFFVFYPIDLIFLDKDKNVVELKENFKPFHIYKNINPSIYLIELKKGSIKEKNINLGDKVCFSKTTVL
jgi:uncharacterized membrane protein (UPF0127 family)